MINGYTFRPNSMLVRTRVQALTVTYARFVNDLAKHFGLTSGEADMLIWQYVLLSSRFQSVPDNAPIVPLRPDDFLADALTKFEAYVAADNFALVQALHDAEKAIDTPYKYQPIENRPLTSEQVEALSDDEKKDD